MRLSLLDRMDHVARAVFPVLVTLALVMAGTLRSGIPDLSPVVPMLSLIAVYYWSVHMPRLMPFWAVFLIGLLQDFLSGGPLGVATVTLMCVSAFISWRRRAFIGASFVVIWGIFMFVAAGAFVVLWLLTSLAMLQMLDPQPAVFQYLMTLAVYPCFAWMMAWGQRLFHK